MMFVQSSIIVIIESTPEITQRTVSYVLLCID